MNCTCIKTEEERISAGFTDNKLDRPPKAGEVRSVICDQSRLSITTGKSVMIVDFSVQFEGVKKPYPVRLKAEFCPFCGKATE